MNFKAFFTSWWNCKRSWSNLNIFVITGKLCVWNSNLDISWIFDANKGTYFFTNLTCELDSLNLIWFFDGNINVEEGIFSSLFSFESNLEFVVTSLKTEEIKFVFLGR